MTAPTPEEFLLQTGEEYDDWQPTPATDHVALPSPQPGDPLTSIASSLATIAEASHVSAYLDQEARRLREERDEIDRELADALALNQVQTDLLERVAEIIRPSTSKLANSVRAVLEGAAEAVTGEHANEVDAPPAHDAPIEEWVAWAAPRVPEGTDLVRMNRSQIRTVLGIPHDAGEQS